MSLGKYLAEGPGVGFINVCVWQEPAGRWPCPWPSDLSGHMIFSRRQIKITSVSHQKLETSDIFKYVSRYLKCFLLPSTGVEHLKLYRVSLGDLFCFLWLRSDLRKMRFDVEELFTQLDFKLKSCAFFWSEGFSKICPKEFVVFFSFYIAVRDKFRIYQLPQVFGWIF